MLTITTENSYSYMLFIYELDVILLHRRKPTTFPKPVHNFEKFTDASIIKMGRPIESFDVFD